MKNNHKIIAERIVAALKDKHTPMVFDSDEIHGLANYLAVYISTGDSSRMGECSHCGKKHDSIQPKHWKRS